MIAKFRTAWRTFNHWRRSTFPFRLTVLLILLVFAGGALERVMTENHSLLINQMVWDACRAMRGYCEPRVASAYLHYYRARENQRLQRGLRDRIQVGGLQLSPGELAAVNSKPSRVDNKILFDIARRHGIIAAGVSQREYMRTLWAASLSMTAMEFDKDWSEVRQEVFSTCNLFGGKRDWRLGIERSGYVLAEILPLPLSTTVPWFIICLTLAFIAVGKTDRKLRYGLAILLPVIFTLLLSIPAWFEHTWYNRLFFEKTWHGSVVIYFILLACAAGILGIRLRRFMLKHGADDMVQVLLLFIAGILLLFPFGFYPDRRIVYWWGDESFLPGYIFRHLSSYTTLLFCLAGAFMTGYAVKSYFQLQAVRRFKRFQISPDLLCYLIWGITAAWACYLLSLIDISAFNLLLLNFDALSTSIPVPALLESNSVTGEEVIAAGLRITAFIDSVLIGLFLAGPYPKKYFKKINICAMILLIAIFAVLTFFISCRVVKYYFPSQGCSYVKVTFI